MAAGCGGDPAPVAPPGAGAVAAIDAPSATPAERGAALFAKRVGGLACADCHATSGEDQPREDRRFLAHTLRDATRRPHWWYGTISAEKGGTVADAVLTCVARFQQRSWNLVLPVRPDGGKDLSKVEMPAADRDALVAHLESLAAPGPHPASPAKRDASAEALRRVDGLAGDRERGRAVYARSCLLCHGPGGKGDVGSSLRGDSQAPDRWRVIEYVRAGPDRAAREQIDAWMPWFTPDVLPDQDLADVAALLEGDDW